MISVVVELGRIETFCQTHTWITKRHSLHIKTLEAKWIVVKFGRSNPRLAKNPTTSPRYTVRSGVFNAPLFLGTSGLHSERQHQNDCYFIFQSLSRILGKTNEKCNWTTRKDSVFLLDHWQTLNWLGCISNHFLFQESKAINIALFTFWLVYQFWFQHNYHCYTRKSGRGFPQTTINQ